MYGYGCAGALCWYCDRCERVALYQAGKPAPRHDCEGEA